MKSHTYYHWFNTRKKREFIRITDLVEEQLAPEGPDYRHHRTGETNGDAHLKNLLIGKDVTLPITEGKLDLGTWQQVYYAEFDGMRKKKMIIKIIGE